MEKKSNNRRRILVEKVMLKSVRFKFRSLSSFGILNSALKHCDILSLEFSFELIQLKQIESYRFIHNLYLFWMSLNSSVVKDRGTSIQNCNSHLDSGFEGMTWFP